MNYLNIFINIVDKILTFIISCILLLIIFISIYIFYDYNHIIKDYNQEKETIYEITEKDNNSNNFINIDELKQINDDIIGWIKIENTSIDFPLLKSKDNNEYLNMNYKKEYSITGSIFLDYRNNENLKDDYLIIYGHNMSNDRMFGGIKKYSEINYFTSHLGGNLYLNKLYDIKIIGFTLISANDEIYKLNLTKEELYNYFKENAMIFQDDEFNENDNFIILSTCDYINRSKRTVILAKCI